MTLDTKEKQEVEIRIKQNSENIGSGPFPLAVMIQGKDGMSNYQVFPDFKLTGETQKATLQIPMLGKIKCIFFRTYKSKLNKNQNKLFIQKVDVTEKDNNNK